MLQNIMTSRLKLSTLADPIFHSSFRRGKNCTTTSSSWPTRRFLYQQASNNIPRGCSYAAFGGSSSNISGNICIDSPIRSKLIYRCFSNNVEGGISNASHAFHGCKAFGKCSKNQSVIHDLFMSYARTTEDDAEATPCLQVEDLRDLLISIGESPCDETLHRIVKAVDVDGNGTIELEEFLMGCDQILGGSSSSSAIEDDEDDKQTTTTTLDIGELIKTFRTLDRDGNGVLTLDELEGLLSVVGGHLNSEDAQHIMNVADKDGNEGIDLSEFIAFVTNPKSNQYSWRLTSGFRVLLVIGGPGSGKGVLCNKLKQLAGIKHYSSGEMLRQEVESGSVLGKSIESMLEDGQLVPSTTMIALLKKQIGKFPGELLALDGFPRTLENYQDFDTICGAPECAICIDVPDDVMMERILKRGESGSGRSDDNPITALKRIETFHKLTKPTLDCLQDSGIPVNVLDGTGSPNDVWDQLMQLNTPIRMRTTITNDNKNIDSR